MVVSISSIDTLDLFSAILSAVGGGGNGTGKIFLFLLTVFELLPKSCNFTPMFYL